MGCGELVDNSRCLFFLGGGERGIGFQNKLPVFFWVGMICFAWIRTKKTPAFRM